MNITINIDGSMDQRVKDAYSAVYEFDSSDTTDVAKFIEETLIKSIVQTLKMYEAQEAQKMAVLEANVKVEKDAAENISSTNASFEANTELLEKYDEIKAVEGSN